MISAESLCSQPVENLVNFSTASDYKIVVKIGVTPSIYN